MRDLLERVDPLLALDYWSREGIAARAISRAAEAGCRHATWDGACTEIRRRAAATQRMQEVAALGATRVLATHGIRSVVFKGPVMATELFGDATLRSVSGDIDLLVDTEHLLDAGAVLQATGWQPPRDALFANGLPRLHLALRGQGPVPAVELHWRVHWYDEGQHAREILDRANVVNGLPVPHPRDTLDILLLCWARDGFHRLRLAADIAASDHWKDDSPSLTSTAALMPMERALECSRRVLSARLNETGRRASPQGIRLRTAVAVGRHDRPLPVRARSSQAAVVDLLVAPGGQARRSVTGSWWLSSDVVRTAHPKVPPALLPLGRLVSFLRTSWHAGRIVSRAAWEATRGRLIRTFAR